MRIDAHCHTDCSDGNVTIEERIALIKACHYDAATITDHDFISGEQVARARQACAGLPFIPGIELSLRHQGRVVHLLGYFVDPDHPGLHQHLRQVQEIDRLYTQRLLDYFCRRGARLELEELAGGSLHTFYSLRLVKRLAADLFDNDPARCLSAFQAAMQALGFAYADLAPWAVRPAIELIHQAGGIAVLAHPGGKNERVMAALGFLLHDGEHLRQYRDWGLDGIETLTPVHSPEEIRLYTQWARGLDLLATAGSDCHGDDPYLGPALMGRSIEIPPNSYENLLAAHQARAGASGKAP
jgi:predicted metal-dependent phosphoesterase TrpH